MEGRKNAKCSFLCPPIHAKNNPFNRTEKGSDPLQHNSRFDEMKWVRPLN